MLKIENLSVNYGGIEAVRDISFEVPEGRRVFHDMSEREKL